MPALLADGPASLMRLQEAIRRVGGSSPVSFTDPIEALDAIRNGHVDLILVDYRMPGMNGIDFMREVRRMPGAEGVPIVIVTTSDERAVRIAAALECNATEFVTKPIDIAEVHARIRSLLRQRDAQNEFREKAVSLGREARRATTGALANQEEEIILRLLRATEHHDAETGNHPAGMALYCRLIAEALGLEARTCHDVYLAAPMHDIGKIAVSDSILLKPDALTQAERSSVQRHTTEGYHILANSGSDLIRTAAEIAYSHHERWDGMGYPRGLGGTEIPLLARIAAVADVFEALTSERPYKPAWTPDEARTYISANSGRQFDPNCVRAFLDRWGDVLAIHRACADSAAETKIPRATLDY